MSRIQRSPPPSPGALGHKQHPWTRIAPTKLWRHDRAAGASLGAQACYYLMTIGHHTIDWATVLHATLRPYIREDDNA